MDADPFQYIKREKRGCEIHPLELDKDIIFRT